MKWIKKEFFHILPVFLFFGIAFFIINGVETLLFKRAGITPFSTAEILVGAALVAKVFLVIDHWSFVDLFSRKPLFYTLLWKTFLYWIILISVRLAVRITPYFFGGEGVEGDLSTFSEQFNWPLFFSFQAYYVMLVFLFITARELTRVLGAQKMRKIFFG